MKVPVPTTHNDASWPEAEVERAATKDPSHPELSEPYLTRVDGVAYLCATDRYILAMVPVEADDEPAGYVPAEALRMARKWKGLLEINKSEVAVPHPKGNSHLTLERPDLGMFPILAEMLVEKALSERDSTATICLNVEFLYRAARAIGARKIRLRLPAATHRPIIVEPTDNPDGRIALVMPIRMPAETN